MLEWVFLVFSGHDFWFEGSFDLCFHVQTFSQAANQALGC